MGCEVIEVNISSRPTIEVSSSACGGSSVDTSEFLLTGDAAILYYPRNSNPSGYITSLSASGVTSLNSLAGVISLTGVGNNTITLSGQYIVISGNSSSSSSDNDNGINLSGNLYSTGQVLNDKTNTLSGYVNNFFVNRTSSQSITGQKTFTNTIYTDNISGANSTVGLDLVNGLINIGGATSVDYNSKQLNNNLGNPTVRWNNYILNDSSQNTATDWNNRLLKTDAVTTTLDWSGRILSGTWTVLGAIRVSGNALITGIDTSSFATITNLTNTGINILNVLTNYTGYQNTNPSGYATALNLQSTGQNLYNIITSASGVLNYLNRVSGISVTGGNYITGGIIIWAGDGIEVLQEGYNIIISTPIAETGGTVLNGQLLIGASGINSYEQGNLYGYSGIAIISGSGSLGVGVNATIAMASNLYTTGQTLLNTITNTGVNLYNYINIFSGNSQSFTTSITPTGLDRYLISFPFLFPIIPKIQATLEISGENLYSLNITGRTTGNYTALFSEVIGESGVIIHTYATIN